MAKYNVKGAVVFDMEFTYGTDWRVDYECVDEEGTVISLASSPTIQWRLSNAAGTTMMTRTVADGITITGAATGLCSLDVTAAMQTTATVAESTRYQYEMRITDSSGIIYPQSRGHLNVLPSLLA